MKVRKFERDYGQILEYEFINAYPTSITSMPVSYDTSSLLKCTVSFSYIRYILKPPTTQPTLSSLSNLTNKQAATFNGAAFNPNANLGLDYSKFTTTGGVTYPSTQASGNTVAAAFNSPSLI